MSRSTRFLFCSFTLSIFTILLTPMATSAQQLQCGPRSPIIEELAKDYGEKRVGVGVVPNGALVELFVSKEGTWTILMSPPALDAPACLVFSGEGWDEDNADQKDVSMSPNHYPQIDLRTLAAAGTQGR